MNRVCLTKDGKLIEMQGGGDDRPDLMEMRLDTLRQNAIRVGYEEDEITTKWVTDEEWATMQDVMPKPDSPPDILGDIATWVSQQENPPQSVIDYVAAVNVKTNINLSKGAI